MQEIDLNIIPKGIPDVVYVSQFEVGRELRFNLKDETQTYTIPSGASVIIGGRKGDETVFTYEATIETGRHSVTVVTTEQMTAIAGENLCQLRVEKSGVELATVNFRMIVQERPDVVDLPSESDIPVIVSLAREQEANAQAWAEGKKGDVPVSSSEPQYNNHAKYWAEQAEAAAESFAGGVIYKGAITFANIPVTGQENGWMYNVIDSFTTDSRFAEGTGKYCEAGTNIVWDGTTSLWDVAGGLGGVQSFNGRNGNITPAANDYDATQVKYGTNSNVNAELDNKFSKGVLSNAPLAIGKNPVLHHSETKEIEIQIAINVSSSAYEYSIKTDSHPKVTYTYPQSALALYFVLKDSSGNVLFARTVKRGSGYTYPLAASDTCTIEVYTAESKISVISYGEIFDSDDNLLGAKADKIDVNVKADSTLIADMFSPTKSYAVGDYVMYSGGLIGANCTFYKCTTAHTGAWDASDFTAVLVSDELGGGGSSVSPYTSNPAMDGVASAGSSNNYSRGDHVHPSDTSKANASIIADAFDSATSYAEGDYVMYNGVFYKCTTAHSGAWDFADFTETKVSDEFGSGGGGGQTTEYRYNIITKSTGNYDASITVIKYVDNIVASSTDYLYSSLSTPVTLDGFLTLSYANMKYTMTLLQASQTNPAGYSEQWAYNATVDLTQTFLVSGADLSYIAPLFSAATAYAVGDLVTHDGKFYKCTTAHSAGAWNSAHFTVTDADTAFAHQDNVVTSHVLDIGNYMEVGSWSQGNDFVFDGSTNRYLMAITALVSIPASAWSSMVDSDGYYTASVITGTAYFNTWIRFFVECGGSPTNIDAKPTAEQKAAFSLVETFHMNTANSTNIMTCYAKTKPTTDFYIIVSGWFMN